MIALALCLVVSVYDGDGPIHCASGERLRLLGVQAADYETAEPCRRRRPGFVCSNRLADRARDNLRRLAPIGATISYEAIKRDRYGRIIANAWAGTVNLSCAQVRGGFAAYRADYDTGGRLRRICR